MVTPVAHRAAENVGSAYQAAKPHVEAAVVYAAPHVKHGVKYAAIQALRFVIKAERQFLDYVEAHLPKEDAGLPPVADARLPLAEPVEPSPVAKPKMAA
jgi:lipopolysaccharide biosynthesis regulator YciM